MKAEVGSALRDPERTNSFFFWQPDRRLCRSCAVERAFVVGSPNSILDQETQRDTSGTQGAASETQGVAVGLVCCGLSGQKTIMHDVTIGLVGRSTVGAGVAVCARLGSAGASPSLARSVRTRECDERTQSDQVAENA
jgi:hypothetical protein